jgi:hypothetical protein
MGVSDGWSEGGWMLDVCTLVEMGDGACGSGIYNKKGHPGCHR